MLFLLLLTSLGPVLQTEPSTDVQKHLDNGEIPSQAERLELASTLWEVAEPIPLTGLELRLSTGIIRIQAGEFDPLISDGPLLDSHFIDFNDPVQTGLALLQLHKHDGNVLEQLMKEYSITPLDYIADEGWLIRLSSPPLSSLEALQVDERVRWVGVQQPGWRIHSSLLEPTSTSHLALIPSSDLAVGGLGSLSLDLVKMGAEEAWCGIGLCEVHYNSEFQSILLNNIMHDGRIIWAEPTTGIELHNAVAGAIVGLNDVAANASFTLNGSGETIAISDTGLDVDHPDILGRVAGVYTKFGLDSSSSDSNTGHGTHVVLSALGDGSGDASAKGIAPEASLVMYALEHDPTGYFGRIGSIYDLLNDAQQKTARISINAWGLNGNYGQYTADSRSVDLLVNDKNIVLPLYSVGDRGNQGASQVSAPATAKNVLAVGTSQTGALAGSVANISSHGPSLDGRIKPDIVAPGMDICSGSAEEAKSSAGFECATGIHADGGGLYVSLSGSSHATAIAGGTTALVRQFLREQVQISSPSAALIKATVINGATDLGTPDIPNSLEGWGQIDLERTVLPMDGSLALNTFYDDNKELNAGFGLLYSFTIDPSHGIDMTLVWSDEEGSANAPQSSARLVNDLDLILIDPSGNEWLGNDFSSGFSTTGGSADSINNVERIKVAPGVLSSSGQWQVKVIHRGGTSQMFGLVMVADATPTPQADLATYNGSIVPSSQEPLKNDLISLQISWINQGTLASNSYHVTLEDLTTNETLFDSVRSGIGPGVIDSLLLQHQFSMTGTHQLRLSLDTLNQVVEINDGTDGVNNNIWIEEIEVTELGVRVVVLDSNGSAPTSAIERSSSAIKYFDVLNDTGIDIPIHVLHEGTGQQAVTLSVTNVQMPAPGRPNFLLPPEDTWTKNISDGGPYTLEAEGDAGDFKMINIHLENVFSDLSDSSVPRYARAGTFVVDVIARYQSQQTISHTQRITIVVPEVNAVNIGAAGIDGLSAAPGDSTGFVISVMNIGNTPGQYTVSCSSENRWQVMLGSSNSSTLEFEPLNINEALPMFIQIFVPPVSDGAPVSGSIDTVTCWVNSLRDAEMNFTQSVVVEVLPQESFASDLYDDIGPIGPSANNRNVLVDTGEQVSLNLTIENTGNTAIDFDVIIQPSNPLWPIQVSYLDQLDNRKISLTLQGGANTTVNFVLGVPPVAEEGETNMYVIRTERNAQAFVSNTTVLKVSDDLSIGLLGPSTGVIETAISLEPSFGEFQVSNTGNAPLTLNWSHGLAPDGWAVGFANPSTYIEPREERTVLLGFSPPVNTPVSDKAFELVITVFGFNQERMISTSITVDVSVLASSFANITVEDSDVTPFILVSRGETVSQNIIIRNDGNVPLSGDVLVNVIGSDGNVTTAWTASCSKNSIESLAVGEQLVLRVDLTPTENAQKGKVVTSITLNSSNSNVGTLGIESSVDSARGSKGLLSYLPLYISLPGAFVFIIGAIVLALRMKKSGELTNTGEELVAPDAFVNPDHLGTRREDALDIGYAVDDIASGEVSSDEIAAALAQSLQMPSPIVPAAIPAGLPPGVLPQGLPLPQGVVPTGLPPKSLPQLPMPLPSLPMPQPMPAPVATLPPLGPPLPAAGLPNGWTMEQWQHYGQQWLDGQ